jgi:hypothetical protein
VAITVASRKTARSTLEIHHSEFLGLRLHKEFDEAVASTRLNERPDYSWGNEFLLKARQEMATAE